MHNINKNVKIISYMYRRLCPSEASCHGKVTVQI